MVISVVEEIKWQKNEYEKFFNLIKMYKEKFNTKIHYSGISSDGKKLCHSFEDNLTIYFESGKKNWIHLEATWVKEIDEVKERFDFILKIIKEEVF